MFKTLFEKYINPYWTYIKLALIGGLTCAVVALSISNNSYKDKINTYKNNLDAALTECVTWKTSDSLSVAKNDVLELRIKDLEKYRNDDLKTINSLKRKNEDLKNLLTTNSETKVEIQTVVEDSIVYVVDSAAINYKVINWEDEWATFNGILDKDTLTATFVNRDKLVCSETITYKKFLGFLWKTKKIKDKNVIITSKNPHTEIINVDFVEILN